MGTPPLAPALALVLFVLGMLGPAAYGQENGGEAFRPFRDLGRYVRIDDSGLGRQQGYLFAASDTTLTLWRRGETTLVRLSDIERLWARRRPVGKGALIGAIVGVAAGVAYGLAISTVACEPVDGGSCTAAQLAAVTGVIGGAGGAAAGAGVGMMIPVWTLRYP